MEVQPKTNNFEKDIQRIGQIPSIENILEVICNSTGMGFATVTRVTKERWIACAVNDKINFGLGVGGELKIETTLCNEVMDSQKTIAIDNVNQDPTYCNHHTPKMYGLQSYISIPIILKNGDFFGTLCAIDPEPALVNNKKTINMFLLFAELIAFHLDSINQLSQTEEKLIEEQKNAEIREQFIAMLGHDLRNPVSAISTAVQLQLRGSLDERNMKLAKIIQDSCMRTRGLIDNILDFASGRLGGGIKLNFDNVDSLQDTLNQVITELRIVYPDRLIQTNINFSHDVNGDNKRIAQLFSNLLGNAITHGEAGSPIIVCAKSNSEVFELSVSNKGKEISAEAMKHLFKPFSRGKVHHGQEGLGLGLYIAKEIASAHMGTLAVESSDTETRFMLKMPS
jgi:signal transduction histidine kinase